jgi:hypothetical protein
MIADYRQELMGSLRSSVGWVIFGSVHVGEWVSKLAILKANYTAKVLGQHYPVLYTNNCLILQQAFFLFGSCCFFLGQNRFGSGHVNLRTSKLAILKVNYMAKVLGQHYPVLYTGGGRLPWRCVGTHVWCRLRSIADHRPHTVHLLLLTHHVLTCHSLQVPTARARTTHSYKIT